MTPLHVRSMLGLGDCIHERAVIRQLMARHQVYLETVWPCVFHDLVCDGLVLLPQATTLRTQANNAVRQAALYSEERPSTGTRPRSTRRTRCPTCDARPSSAR